MIAASDIDVQARAERAAELFLAGYNCCQSVVLAFADLLPVDEESLKNLTSGFGGGVARMREVCGAVSGMVILAGFISGAPDPKDMAARTANYELIQSFAAKYKEEFGSIICRDILGLKAASQTAPQPSERTQQYYHHRPCARSCYVAAHIVAEHLASAGQ